MWDGTFQPLILDFHSQCKLKVGVSNDRRWTRLDSFSQKGSEAAMDEASLTPKTLRFEDQVEAFPFYFR